MEQGYTPGINEKSESSNPLAGLQNRVSTKDRIVFTRQLATLINAGLPLAQSLHTVRDQTANKKLQSIAQDIVTEYRRRFIVVIGICQTPQGVRRCVYRACFGRRGLGYA